MPFCSEVEPSMTHRPTSVDRAHDLDLLLLTFKPYASYTWHRQPSRQLLACYRLEPSVFELETWSTWQTDRQTDKRTGCNAQWGLLQGWPPINSSFLCWLVRWSIFSIRLCCALLFLSICRRFEKTESFQPVSYFDMWTPRAACSGKGPHKLIVRHVKEPQRRSVQCMKAQRS